MSYLVISTSLNPDSRSRAMARHAHDRLRAAEVKTELLDLQDMTLPQCGLEGCYEAEDVQAIAEKIRSAAAVVIATPIYNFSASASTKNLIELTGKVWVDKPVGFLCAAGGPGSYMSIMGLANHLMLDFRSIIIPRFVYAHDASFKGAALSDAAVEDRIDELARSAVRFGRAFDSEHD
jgi:NAD(P)H-dependent FMN reductase